MVIIAWFSLKAWCYRFSIISFWVFDPVLRLLLVFSFSPLPPHLLSCFLPKELLA